MSETVLIAQLPSEAAAFRASGIFVTLARACSHCHYSQSNESSSHATRGRCSGTQDEKIKWPPHKANMSLDNKTCVLNFCLFYQVEDFWSEENNFLQKNIFIATHFANPWILPPGMSQKLPSILNKPVYRTIKNWSFIYIYV